MRSESPVWISCWFDIPHRKSTKESRSYIDVVILGFGRSAVVCLILDENWLTHCHNSDPGTLAPDLLCLVESSGLEELSIQYYVYMRCLRFTPVYHDILRGVEVQLRMDSPQRGQQNRPGKKVLVSAHCPGTPSKLARELDIKEMD